MVRGGDVMVGVGGEREESMVVEGGVVWGVGVSRVKMDEVEVIRGRGMGLE